MNRISFPHRKLGLRVLAVSFAIAAFVCVAIAVPSAWADSGAFGEAGESVRNDTAGNVTFAGSQVDVSQDVKRDVMAAASQVNVGGISVGGDVVAAGQAVKVDGAHVEGDLRAAGNDVLASGAHIGGNITAAGSTLSFDENTSAAAVYVAGADVSYQGTANYVALAGGRVYFDGQVDGDVLVDAESVTIGEHAKVTGTITVRGAQPDIAEGAQAESVDVQLATGPANGNVFANAVAGALVTLLTMAFTIAIMLWIAPTRPKDSLYMLQARTGPMIATGLVALMVVPGIVIALALTGVGLLVAVAIACIACALGVLGLPFLCAAIAQRITKDASLWVVVLASAAIAALVACVPVANVFGYVCGGAYLAGYALQLAFLKLQSRKAQSMVPEQP
jgi:cytoskeletal protein CcmA (bactofilin family)